MCNKCENQMTDVPCHDLFAFHLMSGMFLQAGREELVKRVHKAFAKHKDLLELFLRELDDQVEVLITFEDFAGAEPGPEFADEIGHHFAQASVFAKVSCFSMYCES